MISFKWNYNMNEAPKGEWVKIKTRSNEDGEPVYRDYFKENRLLTLGKDGEIRPSFFIPKTESWQFYSKDMPPVAWVSYDDLKPE